MTAPARIEDFLGPGNEALARAVAALADETRSEVVFSVSLTHRALVVRTQASRIVPAGRLRRKPRRVLLEVREALSVSGLSGRTGVWVPAR